LLNNLSGEFEFTVAGPASVLEGLSAGTFEHLPLKLGGSLQPCTDYGNFRVLRKAMRERKFDLVHAHGFKASLVARPAARACRVPCLVTVHNDFASANRSRFRPAYLTAERALVHWTAGYISVSEWLAKEMRELYRVPAELITVIPNGIAAAIDEQEQLLQLPVDSDVPLVGTVARLAPQKGIQYFIQAAALLRKKHPEIRYCIVGDGPLRPELEELSRQLGLADHLYFLGYRPDVPAILKRLRVFVQPSLSEGQGLTVLEAMAAGCPVAVSAAGGLPELIRDGENGLLFTAGKADELAHAVSRLLADRALAMRLAGKARTDAARFDLGKMLEKTGDLYRRIIREGGLSCEKFMC